jgi:nucleotide-binding universal stress UspA family protein
VVPLRAAHVDDRTDLRPFESHDRDGVRVRRVTLRGEPERVIPAYAQLYEATVLVVERDYGSSRFWRNGRVVDEMAHRSAIPLLVLPERHTTGRDESAPRRILTPVDFSVTSAVALRTAVELARRHGARVTVLHTLNDMPRHMTFSGGGAWEVVRRLPGQKEAAAKRLRRKAAFFGADDVDTEVATGLADSAILESARRSDPDLIVMGIAHRSWLDRLLFGSTLRRVFRRAMVPVLVVPVVGGAHTWPDEHLVDDLGGRVWTDSAGGRVAA